MPAITIYSLPFPRRPAGSPPRFLINSFGYVIVIGLFVGLTFLVFDRRHRDETARISEALHVRPFTNIELVLGRSLGLMALMWGSVLSVACLIQVAGFVSQSFGWWLEPIEPVSLMTFAFIEAPATLWLWCALMQVAATVPSRLVALLLGIALFALQLWCVFFVPTYLQTAVSALPSFGEFSSDLAPYQLDGRTVLHHVSTTLVAMALTAFAAARQSRVESPSFRYGAAGAALVLVGSWGLLHVALDAVRARAERDTWRLAQEAALEFPAPDVEKVSGSVRIRPDEHLELDLVLEVRSPERRWQTTGIPVAEPVGLTPAGAELDSSPRPLVFGFNPAMRITSLMVDGSVIDYRHKDGVLRIDGVKSPDRDRHSLAIKAHGVPDPDFAYLDGAIDPFESGRLESHLGALGAVASIFHTAYVALMPATRWMPSAGANLSPDNPRVERDYFAIDIEVEIPRDWHVVGPGTREERDQHAAESAYRRVRFHSSSPIPQMALAASRFERRTLSVSGVEIELLVSPKHTRNLHVFAGIEKHLESVLEFHFTEASAVGLDYPYERLSVVEAPTRLRGYGGGWRLDTVLSQPGVMFVREQGFPTARFAGRLAGPPGEGTVYALRRYFNSDRSGGNVVAEVLRNFVVFQTSGAGEAGAAIDFVLGELAKQSLVYTRGFFTAYPFGPRVDGPSSGLLKDVADVVMGSTASIYRDVEEDVESPATWARAEETTLRELDAYREPRDMVNVLALKGWRVAQTLHDVVGRVRVGEFLAALRRHHTGHSFGLGELQALVLKEGLPPEITSELRLKQVSMPGFLASEVVIQRLPDDETGARRFQLRFHVRNDEPMPGWLRVRGLFEGSRPGFPQNRLSDPVRIGGESSVEMALTYQRRPREVWLVPYLSLNRREIRLDVRDLGEGIVDDAEDFVGERASEWLPVNRVGVVVVDDLDPEFFVRQDGHDGWRPQIDPPFRALDNGIPAHGSLVGFRAPTWTRQELPSSWGRYRQTVVRTGPDDHGGTAVFSADLPTAGRWSLYYHLPHLDQVAKIMLGSRFVARYAPSIGALGLLDVVVATGTGETAVRFDAGSAEAGWNSVGTFELAAGRVDVVVSGRGDGSVVLADAIRWAPAEGTFSRTGADMLSSVRH